MAPYVIFSSILTSLRVSADERPRITLLTQPIRGFTVGHIKKFDGLRPFAHDVLQAIVEGVAYVAPLDLPRKAAQAPPISEIISADVDCLVN